MFCFTAFGHWSHPKTFGHRPHLVGPQARIGKRVGPQARNAMTLRRQFEAMVRKDVLARVDYELVRIPRVATSRNALCAFVRRAAKNVNSL